MISKYPKYAVILVHECTKANVLPTVRISAAVSREIMSMLYGATALLHTGLVSNTIASGRMYAHIESRGTGDNRRAITTYFLPFHCWFSV